jgi:hypothetical protein
MRLVILVPLLAPLVAPAILAAQAPPPSNLWSVPLSWEEGRLVVGRPVKLTGDRGVNSQPSFSPDGNAIVFSAIRDTGRDARSDIYRIDLGTGAERRITRTPENENSPIVDARGQYVAVRWVPATLFKEFGPWMYDSAGTPLRGVLPAPDTTGYYTPLPDGRWALTRPKPRGFTIGLFTPRSGAIVDVDTGVPALPAVRIPGVNALSWVRIDSAAAHHELRRYELASGRRTSLGRTLRGRTAHAWVPRRDLVLMARGNVLYARKVAGDTAWRPVATFDDPGLRHMSAYVVSPRGDRLIVVSPVRLPLAVALRDSLESGRTPGEVAAMLTAWREAGRLVDYDVSEGTLGALADDRYVRRLPADAVLLHQAIVATFPASHRALARLGDAQAAAGDTATARVTWRRAIDANPRATDDERRAAETLERRLSQP